MVLRNYKKGLVCYKFDGINCLLHFQVNRFHLKSGIEASVIPVWESDGGQNAISGQRLTQTSLQLSLLFSGGIAIDLTCLPQSSCVFFYGYCLQSYRKTPNDCLIVCDMIFLFIFLAIGFGHEIKIIKSDAKKSCKASTNNNIVIYPDFEIHYSLVLLLVVTVSYCDNSTVQHVA